MPGLAVVRNENGQVVSGTLSPKGSTGGPRVALQRMFDARISHGPNKFSVHDVDTFAGLVRDAVLGISDDVELRNMALQRMWPAAVKIELPSAEDVLASETGGATAWDGLSEFFGEEFAQDPAGSTEAIDVESTPVSE